MPWSKENLPESVKKLASEWSEQQISTFVSTANHVLETTGDEGEAIATGIKQAKGHKENAKQEPQSYYCRHMQIGVAQYVDEMILVDMDCLKKMIPSFRDKPVFVRHQEVDLENLQAQADGYVTDSFYNEVDGWLWAKFIIVSDEGHKAVMAGWSVSNSYAPTAWAGSGTHHNVAYDRKITDGVFNHLAIVPDPRYEDAKIYSCDQFKIYQEEEKERLKTLNNSKTGVTKMLKFFRNERKEVSNIDENTMIELDGKEIAVKDMIALVKNAKEEEEKEKASKMNDDDEVDVGGEKMPLKELINRYSNLKGKKNADEDDSSDADEKNNAEDEAKKKDEEEKANKKNAEDEEAKKKAEEEEKAKKKENSKHFDDLKNAPFINNNATKTIDLAMDMVARGKARYGSGK